jgi:CBS domain-containing protein
MGLPRPTHGAGAPVDKGGTKGTAMKVQEIMVSKPLTCGPQTNLAEVANLMWKGDCGIVPITDNAGKLLGVITDRDICIAASTQGKAPSHMNAGELPHGDLYTCRAEDDARAALNLMRERRVRRVPVTGADGTLQGIVSINDIVLAAGGKADVSAADVLDTFKGICAHRPPLTARAAGAGAA